MTTEDLLLVAAFAGGAIGLWMLKRWDERRMDHLAQIKFPKATSNNPLQKKLTWEQKKQELEQELKRAHSISDGQALAPYAGFLLGLAVGFRFFGGIGLLFGIPLGIVAYYLVKAWVSRGRAKAAKALADHLGSDRGGSYLAQR